MNEKRRTALLEAAGFLDSASDLIRRTLTQEAMSMDNVPDNLRSAGRFDRMDDAIEAMEEAIQNIDDAKESLRQARS